jgi:hypothetical protein
VVKGNNQMEVGKGIVYPHLVLDDVWIDSYENAKNLKLEVPLDDMMLKLWDAITRSVQWRRIAIDIKLAATLASTTASQPYTTFWFDTS